MADQLVDFFRHRKEQLPSHEIDWQAKKDLWLRSVESLFEQVSEMLADSITSGVVKVRRFKVEVTEDFIGTYSAPALEVIVGNERVDFRPKGVTVMGAMG